MSFPRRNKPSTTTIVVRPTQPQNEEKRYVIVQGDAQLLFATPVKTTTPIFQENSKTAIINELTFDSIPREHILTDEKSAFDMAKKLFPSSSFSIFTLSSLPAPDSKDYASTKIIDMTTQIRSYSRLSEFEDGKNILQLHQPKKLTK